MILWEGYDQTDTKDFYFLIPPFSSDIAIQNSKAEKYHKSWLCAELILVFCYWILVILCLGNAVEQMTIEVVLIVIFNIWSVYSFQLSFLVFSYVVYLTDQIQIYIVLIFKLFACTLALSCWLMTGCLLLDGQKAEQLFAVWRLNAQLICPCNASHVNLSY